MGLRLGFLGTGGIAGAHLKNLQTFGEVKLAAHCDLDAGRAAEAAATYGGRAYTDYRGMFDTANLDAVKNGGGSQILPPYSGALASFRLLVAASESFRTGQVVDI